MVLEMHECAFDVVGSERAADAPRRPAGTEHEMMDDQLAAPIKQIGERLLPVRSFENILLLYLDPW